jgi:MFS family permease
MPFFADDMFHRGSQGLGTLMAAMGAGAVVGVLGLASRAEVHGLARVLAGSAAMLGLGFLAFSQSHSFALSIAIMAVIGFSIMRQMASANTLLQTMIPDHYRGRLMALYSMTVVGLGPFGSLAAGGLAHAAGARVTVLTGGAICLAAAILFHWFASRGAYD